MPQASQARALSRPRGSSPFLRVHRRRFFRLADSLQSAAMGLVKPTRVSYQRHERRIASPPQLKRVMTVSAKGYQIEFDIITQSAPPLDVTDLKILHAPTRLASPAISV
jgi:hypothetical protein